MKNIKAVSFIAPRHRKGSLKMNNTRFNAVKLSQLIAQTNFQAASIPQRQPENPIQSHPQRTTT